MKTSNPFLITVLFAVLFGQSAAAQDSTAVDECAKWRGLYFQYLKQKMYYDAATMWSNAVKACGADKLDAKFWVNGRVIYTSLAKEYKENPTRLTEINDTIDWIYEQKLKLGEDSEWSLDYVIFLMDQKHEDHAKLDHLFKHIHILKDKCKPGVIKDYFTHLITNKFNKAPETEKEAVRAFVIEEYMVLMEYLSVGMTGAKAAADEKKIGAIQNAMDFLDKYFLQLASDCTILTGVFDKQLSSLPHTPEAKKLKVTEMLKLMDKKNCSKTETYGKYLDTLIKCDPSAEAYYLAGRNADANEKTDKAVEYFKKASELEGDGPNKDKYLFEYANALYKNNSFKAAFGVAKQVNGELKGDALMICAGCIVSTANGCGESTFARKANYWLANDYVNRAIAAGKNGVSSSKYLDSAPTSQDVFTEGLQMGSSYSLSCWGESTTLR